ncbi:uncharacterized protein A4U43_C08F27600 [Asparagus officinalis]|nr:uncharacterized protein A4U43_C08F27600 [Asparagus officinalis]
MASELACHKWRLKTRDSHKTAHDTGLWGKIEMSNVTRACMAASVAVVQGCSDFRYMRNGKGRIRPSISKSTGTIVRAVTGNSSRDCQGDEDESIRKVMYLSCWGPG